MKENFIQIDGLRIRYFEQGTGPHVLLLHGASLGSSADVWVESLPAFAAHGFHVIAFDQPGFGLSDNPTDHSVAYRQRFILAFMDALGLDRTSLIGHSQAGRLAVSFAFEHSQRTAKVIVLGTGSLLPPLPGDNASAPREGEDGGAAEPTLEETRRRLAATLFNPDLITPQALETRHRMSTGKNFQAFLARSHAPTGNKEKKEAVPLWQRLADLPVPLLLIYGKQDRGAAADRAALAKQRYPILNLYVFDRCGHLIQWDAAAQFVAVSARFLAN